MTKVKVHTRQTDKQERTQNLVEDVLGIHASRKIVKLC